MVKFSILDVTLPVYKPVKNCPSLTFAEAQVCLAFLAAGAAPITRPALEEVLGRSVESAVSALRFKLNGAWGDGAQIVSFSTRGRCLIARGDILDALHGEAMSRLTRAIVEDRLSEAGEAAFQNRVGGLVMA